MAQDTDSPPPSNPHQQWRFDSKSIDGMTLKATNGALGGEILGAIKQVNDEDLDYLEIAPANDGSGGGILLSRDPTTASLPTGAMTVEAWVQLESTLEWGGIIGAVLDTGPREAGWVMGYRRDRFFFGLTTTEAGRITYLNSSSPFVLKAWYQVVASYDGIGTQRLYIDGRLSAQSEVQRGAILQPDPLFYVIGAYRDDNNYHPFSGRLANISVWHRTLTSEEIGARFSQFKDKFPGIEDAAPERPGADNEWATWMGDNLRSGRALQGVQLHPSGKPQWVYHPTRLPAPAWPETARSDHWRKRATPETPKVTFDWVHDVAVAGGKVFFGSSADDSLRCLDASNGEVVWTFHAGGPVRLAPTVSEGRVVFGCDDGAVYCLNAVDGRLNWKARPASAPDRRLPGNGRLMSVWPVRTGVLVKGDTGYFGAGLFPGEGAWYCTVDLRDGRIIDEKPVDFSPQGYIFENGGRLFSQAGRARTAGTLGTVAAGSKASVLPQSRISNAVREKYPYALVETPERIFVGGDQRVAAFEPGSDTPVWAAEIDAPARGLAIASGQLFVSTTKGSIFAFGATAGDLVHREAEKENHVFKRKVADSLIARLPRERGYALVVGVGDGSLLGALAERSQLHVIGVDTDGSRISKLRSELVASGLYGSLNVEETRRGSVALQTIESIDRLPFVDGIFNLVTIGQPGEALPISEAKRLIRPWDGLAVLDDDVVLRGEALPGAGSWTHAYADAGNSASSNEQHVDGETRLRWFGRPGPDRMVDRHMRASPPLGAGGYLLVPGRDYLYGLDAHNGTVLWERELPAFMRASMLRDCGNLVLDPKSKQVFATTGAKCLIINVDTGETTREISVDEADEEWGYLAIADGTLVGSAVDKGAVRRELSYAAIWEGGYGDGKRAVCSQSLFGMDPQSGHRRWTYHPSGAIANPSICIGSGQIFFLESRNGQTLRPPTPVLGKDDVLVSRQPGRWGYGELIEAVGADLVALDLQSGVMRWRRPFEETDGSSILSCYLSCREGRLVAVHSHNTTPALRTEAEPKPESETDSNPAASGEEPAPLPPPKPTLHYDVRVMNAMDGSGLWQHGIDTGRRPNLIHGEQDLHPVIAGTRLVVEPHVFDVATGEKLFSFKRSGGSGCGTISASAKKLYYRASHPAVFDLESQKQQWISRATRPGCWINMIPASGLLLVPEGSSGCICSFPVQASMAFGAE